MGVLHGLIITADYVEMMKQLLTQLKKWSKYLP